LSYIEQSLETYLKNYADLTALVGTRIYPAKLPQNFTPPAITYSRISSSRYYSHSGPSGLARPRFQLSCWAEHYGEAKQVAEQVRAALEAWPATKTVQAAFVVNELDGYEPETKLYHVPVDVIFWHNE